MTNIDGASVDELARTWSEIHYGYDSHGLATAPRPADCAHADDHPVPRYTDFRHSLPQVYAPGDFPATEHSRSLESWTCPRFTATLAQGRVSALGRLDAE
ncbi:hypothetical protein FB563_1297 [Streptomyces puniciscabiei]|uniref:Uncharacterized protein n=1 Tax=Streptomyces puniciscabiei TaxID=164348 RepID=A0A542UB88_9ACTN|nr:hypothetical protein [Streptomyces puniciscabiei]TQK96354.1 hypothetical protein FB563_1297 [Streptomyces puniciscabiei]